ncbi:MAG: molybdopterin-dependent oxidoreductase, partial [Burkholderiales bacterium]
MLLTRKSSAAAGMPSRLSRSLSGVIGKTMDRRTFLKRSGLTVGAGAFASQLPFSMIGKAGAAAETQASGNIQVRRTVCTHCSVGCAIDGVVQNGVWIRQEPVFDSPLNLGAHCAKGASVREHGHGEYRLKYPMKLEGGKWKKINWDQAVNEIGDKMLQIRKESGPD